jgi:fermentation-respiration switch protein FrsA (DUF1100 family)
MTERQDVELEAEGGVTLRGWLLLPDGPGPYPAITMAHGYAGVKEHGLERFAGAFAEDGFVVLVHDHRSFGASDGEPRQDVDPWRQIADWRRAISFLESQPEVENTVTVRSTRAARMYEPGVWIGRVSPTPLLMVVALDDKITLTDLALAACQRALEPKRLELIPGGHFDPYRSSFTQASGAAGAWFREHLT